MMCFGLILPFSEQFIYRIASCSRAFERESIYCTMLQPKEKYPFTEENFPLSLFSILVMKFTSGK